MSGEAGSLRDAVLSLLAQGFDRRAWQGPNLTSALRGVTAQVAAWRPHPARHNIWELVLHTAFWKARVCRALDRDAARFPLRGNGWFVRPQTLDAKSWRSDLRLLKEWHTRLVSIAEPITEAGLHRRRGASSPSPHELLVGIATHDFYHAGQVRLLRRLHDCAHATAGA